MLSSSILLLLGLASAVKAQTTYTGCHNHSTVEYCYGPDGEETALVTYSAVDSSTLTTATLPVSVSASATTTGQTTAVTGCHTHGSDIYCINGAGDEVSISVTATATGEPPAQYTDCHAHGTDQYCMAPDGSEVLIVGSSTAEEDHDDHDDDHDHEDGEEQEMDCHFHAGVEHCVPAGGSEQGESEGAALNCELVERDYDIGLRIGTIFVILVTSAIGVFAPMLLSKLPFRRINQSAFTVVKQFGTGVILSTALVHLYTHAQLMFANQCLGRLRYEGTTSAIVMAGIILAFLFEYVGHRIVIARVHRASQGDVPPIEASSSSTSDTSKGEINQEGKDGKDASASASAPAYQANNLTNLGHSHGNPLDPANPHSTMSVMVMEAGILFHSILIGLTLVVAGDSFYKTLLVVIVFHQFFEGLSLGARIAVLPAKFARFWPTKFFMATAFALITPIGMAIGLGVINSFNGNDPKTIVTIGTLDSLSAGILLWVGLVDMLARDWILDHGEMVEASIGQTLLGGVSLFAGMILMSVLGKWA
ncbi:hypothetical protein PV10_07101 [Exophiala mesophila]|uniref:Uncharacterized protein n=1 Tax=Exophiala mesophila TaxID=212818 RepID=A0A0D1XNN7_EXOME|nr:uncharacterized protein PV10_07101 [Exophiala mesophila]KIV89721.1 hypothetical protein PV10_07101 [Exophiala mesophila]